MHRIMRIPLYVRPGYQPTRSDAYPFLECRDRADAEDALRVLHEFSRSPPGPMLPDPIHHFMLIRLSHTEARC